MSIPDGRVDDAFTATAKATRVKRLKLTQLPPRSTVVVLCKGVGPNLSGCPFFVRAVTPRNGTADIRRIVGGFRFPVGARLDLWLTRGIERGDVVRYTFRSFRLPRFQALCMPVDSLNPRRC